MKHNIQQQIRVVTIVVFLVPVIHLQAAQHATSDRRSVNQLKADVERGNTIAQNPLVSRYTTSSNPPKDAAEAGRWYRTQAEQGDPAAQVILGTRYVDGRGVPKNYIEAYKWFSLASAQGLETARRSLADVERLMTPDQIAEAQRLSMEFLSRKPQTPDSSAPSKELTEARPSTTGSGFFITDDGFLVTNEHVVMGAGRIRVLTRDGLLAANVVKVDAANDLALLKAKGRFLSLPLVTSRGVRLGNTVATVGFPNIGLQGFAPKLAKGEIAALSGIQDDPRCFQISVPLQPGNSGGALVDSSGNVVGVVSAKLSVRAALETSGSIPENVNYAVKSSLLLSFLESLPDVASNLKTPETHARQFEDVVKSAEQAAVLVLVY